MKRWLFWALVVLGELTACLIAWRFPDGLK